MTSQNNKIIEIKEDASLIQHTIKFKKDEYISINSIINNICNNNINKHLIINNEYIILYSDEANTSLNLIKLPFDNIKNKFYGNIFIIRTDKTDSIDNNLIIKNLSTNKFLSLYKNNVKQFDSNDEYSSDDFNPDNCDLNKNC